VILRNRETRSIAGPSDLGRQVVEILEFRKRVLQKEIEEEVAVSSEPEVTKGLDEVIALGHIKENESSTRLVLTNQCLRALESGVASSPNLHRTSRGPVSVLIVQGLSKARRTNWV
jgi:hypothetical protein